MESTAAHPMAAEAVITLAVLTDAASILKEVWLSPWLSLPESQNPPPYALV